MTERRPFNPEQPATKVFGSDGSRFIQEGHFYGAPPHYRLISAPMVGHLAGVQEQDGTVRTLGDLSTDELRELAEGMEIAGATDLSKAELAEAIAAEPVVVLSDELGAQLAALEQPQAVQHTMEQLDAMKVTELRELAKTYGVSGRNKDDLIAEILAAQAKAAAE